MKNWMTIYRRRFPSIDAMIISPELPRPTEFGGFRSAHRRPWNDLAKLLADFEVRSARESFPSIWHKLHYCGPTLFWHDVAAFIGVGTVVEVNAARAGYIRHGAHRNILLGSALSADGRGFCVLLCCTWTKKMRDDAISECHTRLQSRYRRWQRRVDAGTLPRPGLASPARELAVSRSVGET